MNQALTHAIKHWSFIAPLLTRPKSKKDYETLVSCLDELLDVVGSDENHPLMGLVDLMSLQVSNYDNTQLYKSKAHGAEVLKHLMEAHSLKQSDFPELASQGVMSEILKGKRSLNLRQIKLLAKRFRVSPETFMDD